MVSSHYFNDRIDPYMHLVSVLLYTSEQHPYMHLVSVLCIPVSSIPTSLSFFKKFVSLFSILFL